MIVNKIENVDLQKKKKKLGKEKKRQIRRSQRREDSSVEGKAMILITEIINQKTIIDLETLIFQGTEI